MTAFNFVPPEPDPMVEWVPGARIKVQWESGTGGKVERRRCVYVGQDENYMYLTEVDENENPLGGLHLNHKFIIYTQSRP